MSEYRWNAWLPFRGLPVQSAQRQLQKAVVEVDKRVQSYALCTFGDITIQRQMRKKHFHFRRPHFPGVFLLMEVDELNDPVDIGFFGGVRETLCTDMGTALAALSQPIRKASRQARMNL